MSVKITHFHSNSIHSSQKVEETRIPLMDEYTEGGVRTPCARTGMEYTSALIKGDPDTCYHTVSLEGIARRELASLQGQGLCDVPRGVSFTGKLEGGWPGGAGWVRQGLMGTEPQFGKLKEF